jgi:hypothetical protein
VALLQHNFLTYGCQFVLQAADDPIAPEAAIPVKAIEANENCMLVITPAGGHLGWVSGAGAPLGKNPDKPESSLPYGLSTPAMAMRRKSFRMAFIL